jgi:Fic family protein
MGHRALILEAHHTTHIEGTRLTLEQAERLLEGLPVPEADPDDARELLNYRRVFHRPGDISFIFVPGEWRRGSGH